jgi:hypothetical protein
MCHDLKNCTLHCNPTERSVTNIFDGELNLHQDQAGSVTHADEVKIILSAVCFTKNMEPDFYSKIVTCLLVIDER